MDDSCEYYSIWSRVIFHNISRSYFTGFIHERAGFYISAVQESKDFLFPFCVYSILFLRMLIHNTAPTIATNLPRCKKKCIENKAKSFLLFFFRIVYRQHVET